MVCESEYISLQTVLFIAQLCRSPHSTQILMKKHVIRELLEQYSQIEETDRELSF